MSRTPEHRTYHIQIYKCPVKFIEAFKEILRRRNYAHDTEFFREMMREVVKNG